MTLAPLFSIAMYNRANVIDKGTNTLVGSVWRVLPLPNDLMEWLNRLEKALNVAREGRNIVMYVSSTSEIQQK